MKTNGTTINITEGSYCWEGVVSAECVDKVYTNPIEMGKQHASTKVAPNQVIEISFDKKPDGGSVRVEKLVESGNSEEVDLNQSTLHSPYEKGVY